MARFKFGSGQSVRSPVAPAPASSETVSGVVYVDRVVDRPVEVIVEKVVHVPVEKIVHVPVETVVERFVDRVVEKPVEKIIEKVIHVPVEKIVEQRIDVPVHIDRIVPIKHIPVWVWAMLGVQSAVIAFLLSR